MISLFIVIYRTTHSPLLMVLVVERAREREANERARDIRCVIDSIYLCARIYEKIAVNRCFSAWYILSERERKKMI